MPKQTRRTGLPIFPGQPAHGLLAETQGKGEGNKTIGEIPLLGTCTAEAR